VSQYLESVTRTFYGVKRYGKRMERWARADPPASLGRVARMRRGRHERRREALLAGADAADEALPRLQALSEFSERLWPTLHEPHLFRRALTGDAAARRAVARSLGAELAAVEKTLVDKELEERCEVAEGRALLARARAQGLADPEPITFRGVAGTLFRSLPRPLAMLADIGGTAALVAAVGKLAGWW
jgi:hypothetical protein